MEEDKSIGNCETCGEPIYEDEARVEVKGKLYKPEHYVIKEQTVLDKILRR